jgi:hypothetical protein
MERKKDLLLCHSISLNFQIMRRRGAAGGELIYNLKLTHHSGCKWNKMKELHSSSHNERPFC